MSLLSFVEPEKIVHDEAYQDYLKYNKEKLSGHSKPVKRVFKDMTTDQFLCDMDDIIDSFINNNFVGSIPSFKSMFNGLKRHHVKEIMSDVEFSYKEYLELLYTEDPELIESYSLTKYEVRKLMETYKSVLDLCVDFLGSKKRKARTKKVKSNDQLVSKVNVCIEYPQFGLKSVLPANIIGSSCLWVYNVKYKKLGRCYASTSDGLSVKGTTIQGFDEDRSIQKILRKPESIVNKVVSGDKLFLSKVFDDIKTTENKLTGRLNSDIILLRVIK